jgi:hypothetical protein
VDGFDSEGTDVTAHFKSDGKTHPTALRDLLSDIGGAGYRFTGFAEGLEGRSLILRHDIDFCLEAALETARIEAEAGVSATYFFMLSSNFYNLVSQRSQQLVKEVQALGHTISLHYDPTAYTDIDSGFVLERQAFESLFDTKIEIVSLHRPQGFLDDNNRALPGVAHTYQDAYFKDMKYISDSGGAFRFGHPLECEAFQAGQPIHLLLHPIWWVSDEHSPSDKLRRWQQQHHQFLTVEIGRNCRAFDGLSAFGA